MNNARRFSLTQSAPGPGLPLEETAIPFRRFLPALLAVAAAGAAALQLGLRHAHELFGHTVGFLLVPVTGRVDRQLLLNSSGRNSADWHPNEVVVSGGHARFSCR